jgi:excisionase family DNA binding protein
VGTSGEETAYVNSNRHKEVHMSNPALHSIKSAARELGIGRSTLYGLIATQKITTVKIGRRTLITDQSIQQLVDDLISDEVHNKQN